MKISRVLLSLAAAACLTAPAQAAPDYLTGYAGYFDILDKEDTATQIGLEYRGKPIEYGFRPTIGLNGSSDGSFYGYVGFNWDIAMIDQQLYIIPNFMVGAYSDGGGKDLGGPIEFRSGIELAYEFSNMHRLGIAFNHISNGSLYNKNPGAETLLVNYSIPFDSVWKR